MSTPTDIAAITFEDRDSFNPAYKFDDVWRDGSALTASFQGRVIETEAAATGEILSSTGFVAMQLSAPVSSVSFTAQVLDPGDFGLVATIRVRAFYKKAWAVRDQKVTRKQGEADPITISCAENVVSNLHIYATEGTAQSWGIDNVALGLRARSAPVEPSGDPHIDALLGTRKWDVPVVEWSFSTAGSARPGYGLGPETFAHSKARFETQDSLSTGQKAAAKRAFDLWSDVARIKFKEVAEDEPGDIRLARADITWGAAADAFLPGDSAEAGDITVALSQNERAPAGSHTAKVLVHEIGHAIGLSHPHEDHGSGVVAPAHNDSIENSIMSYRVTPGHDPDGVATLRHGHYPTTPMMNDIASVQYLYGPNWSNNQDNTHYTFDPFRPVIFETIWDGGGTDTYDATKYKTDTEIDLRPGKWRTLDSTQRAILEPRGGDKVFAQGNVANALLYKGRERSLIEHAKGGSGDDILIGNKTTNQLEGGQGDDTLVGLREGDLLYGGRGSDRLEGGVGGDILTGGPGPDTLLGGRGNDRFHVNDVSHSQAGRRADKIEDFGRGADVLNLSLIDANETKRGFQEFDWIGPAAFSGTPGELRAFQRGPVSIVQGDVDGDGAADLMLKLLGVVNLSPDSIEF